MIDQFVSALDIKLYLLLQARQSERIEAQQGFGLAQDWQLFKILELFDRHDFDRSMEPFYIQAQSGFMGEAEAAMALKLLQAEVERFEPDPRRQLLYMLRQKTLV